MVFGLPWFGCCSMVTAGNEKQGQLFLGGNVALVGPKDSHDSTRLVATQIFLIFTPKIGEDEPILTDMFQLGGSTAN